MKIHICKSRHHCKNITIAAPTGQRLSIAMQDLLRPQADSGNYRGILLPSTLIFTAPCGRFIFRCSAKRRLCFSSRLSPFLEPLYREVGGPITAQLQQPHFLVGWNGADILGSGRRLWRDQLFPFFIGSALHDPRLTQSHTHNPQAPPSLTRLDSTSTFHLGRTT